MLAALPLVGGMFTGTASAAEAISRRHLQDARDLLMPCVWGFSGNNPDLGFDLTIDFDAKYLLVTGYNLANRNNRLGFAITENSIKNGHYITAFHPSLTYLAKLLRAPELVTLFPLDETFTGWPGKLT